MEKEIKNDLKKLARDTEVRLTESILKWKYNKEGKRLPDKKILENRSRLISDQANRLLYRRGKTLWHELKKAYNKGKNQGD